jgi:hypothetical protein
MDEVLFFFYVPSSLRDLVLILENKKKSVFLLLVFFSVEFGEWGRGELLG